MLCSSEKSSVRATSVFAILYILSGAFITSVGIYALTYLPELFTTGSVIWSGIIVAGLGGMGLIFACAGPVNSGKSMVICALAIVILVVCILNIVLLETVEWKYGIAPVPSNDQDQEERREFLFFLTCLLSLFGTVLGIVTAVCNLIYAYCILLIPMKKLEKRRDILKERVELYNTIKVVSPRGIPDGKTISKPPTVASLESLNKLAKSTQSKVHDWVYNNNDICSDISVSSQGTEMTANKAFLKESMETNATLSSPEQPSADTIPHTSPPTANFGATYTKEKTRKSPGTPYYRRRSTIININDNRGVRRQSVQKQRQAFSPKNQMPAPCLKGSNVTYGNGQSVIPQERQARGNYRSVRQNVKHDETFNVTGVSVLDTSNAYIYSATATASVSHTPSSRDSSDSRGNSSSSWLEISSPRIGHLEDSSVLQTTGTSSGQDTSESQIVSIVSDTTFKMDEIDGNLLAKYRQAAKSQPLVPPPPPPPPLPPTQCTTGPLETNIPQNTSSGQNTSMSKNELDFTVIMDESPILEDKPVAKTPPPPPPPPQPHESQPPSPNSDLESSWVEIATPKSELTSRKVGFSADNSMPPLPPPSPPVQQSNTNQQAHNIAIEELMTQLASTKL